MQRRIGRAVKQAQSGSKARKGLLVLLLLLLVGCQAQTATSTPLLTPTVMQHTPTPTAPLMLTPQDQPLFQTFAQGELLPDMRVPIQRSSAGEGGWYLIIGTEEGWAQFLSQMGQPAEIWQPVQWDQEILVGGLLGVRQGRGYGITITDLALGGVEVVASLEMEEPTSDTTVTPWVVCPFHFIRIPRIELPLGPVTFRFVDDQGTELASHVSDVSEVDIVWLPGEAGVYPTPTPIQATSTPAPTPTPTPVPNLRVQGIVLDVLTDDQSLRIVPSEGDWEYINLMEGTSLMFEDRQPTTLAQLQPGMLVDVLGYPGGEQIIWAAHIDVMQQAVQGLPFASYASYNEALSTIYNGYQLPLSLADIEAPTLSLTQTFGISQTRALTESGFVVSTAEYTSFVSLYNDPQKADYPVFISTDSVLHVSQLLLERIRYHVGQDHLWPELTMLDQEMFALSWAQYEAAMGEPSPRGQRLAVAARHNAAYFAVALSLLDPEFEPPQAILPVVRAELGRITATQAITTSPLFDSVAPVAGEKRQIDYSRFAPAGYDAQDEASLRRFQALTWHQTVDWRLDSVQETLSAVLLTHLLAEHAAPRLLWQRVYALFSFFEGHDGALTLADYTSLVPEVWGTEFDSLSLADEASLAEFVQAVRALQPQEYSIRAWLWEMEEEAPRGCTFLGVPLNAGHYLLAQTMTRETSLPPAVHLAAVLGSPEAYDVSDELGYGAYVNDLDRLRIALDAFPEKEWTADLPWQWLYVYRTLVSDKTLSYPKWMRTEAWRRKELQTMLGSWTEVQHRASLGATVPVTVQERETDPVWGFVEPQPNVYGRLASMVDMIEKGLQSRLMLSAAEQSMLSEWKGWLVLLHDISRRELTGQTVTELEYQRLTEYRQVIERLVQFASGADEKPPSSLVVHRGFATPTTSLVDAAGWIDELYIVVERGGKQYLARGGVYSTYEFEWSIEDPIDDDIWRTWLAAGQAPPRPVWVSDLILPR